MISKYFLENIQKNKFVIIENKKYYFNDILELAEQYKYSLLYNYNIGKSDKILVLLDNSIEFCALLLAIADIEAVIVPINYTQPNIKTYMNLNLKLVVTKSNLRKDIEGLYLDEIVDKNKMKLEGIISEEDYILTMTSGSTSEPKPIIFTQKTKIDRIKLSIKDLYHINENDTILVSTPMYHSLAQRLVLSAFILGTNIVIINSYTPIKFLEYVEKYKVTFSVAVSNQLVNMEKFLDNYDLFSLHTLVSSSALLKDNIKKIYMNKFKNFHEIYGSSEIGTATNLFSFDKSYKSVGRALKYVDIKIIGNNKELAYNQIGEIACKTKTLFKGYYNLDEITKQSFYKNEYFLTGDLGYLDESGFLYFKGRKKDIINVGGSLVFPKDIENVILEVNSVKECAVIGIEDDYFGEVPIVIMVVDNNFDLKQVKLKCLKELSDIQLPKAYEIVIELPKNSMGKIQKFKLKEQYKNFNIGKKLKGIR